VFDGIEAGWGYPISVDDSMPRPVVFLGHFNDARADDCRTEPRQECRALFVVDQVPWVDGAEYDAVFPADIDGIPVWSVEEMIARRDAGELGGIGVAIGGWYAESIPIQPSCALPAEHWGPLERYCHAGQEVLADIPQAIDVTAPPIGTSLTPFFPRYWTSRFPTDRLIPQPVVLVGHVEDPLANDCPHLGVDVCRSFFVVDRIAWIDGESLGPRVPPNGFFDPFGPHVTRSVTDVARFVRQQIPADGIVQALTAIEASDIGSLDPTVGTALEGRGIVWYVRAVERATNHVGSFIVDDATGVLLWSRFPLSFPTPPSAVP
jgi:hypothetical protein